MGAVGGGRDDALAPSVAIAPACACRLLTVPILLPPSPSPPRTCIGASLGLGAGSGAGQVLCAGPAILPATGPTRGGGCPRSTLPAVVGLSRGAVVRRVAEGGTGSVGARSTAPVCPRSRRLGCRRRSGGGARGVAVRLATRWSLLLRRRSGECGCISLSPRPVAGGCIPRQYGSVGVTAATRPPLRAQDKAAGLASARALCAGRRRQVVGHAAKEGVLILPGLPLAR